MTLGRNSSSTLSLKGKPPPENRLQSHMKQFFQFLCPKSKDKGHGSFLGKGSAPSTSMQARDLGKGRAAFSRNTKNQNVLTNVDKVIEEKLGQRHAMSMACAEVPLTSSRKSEKAEYKAELKVQAETIQGRPFSCKPRHDKMTSVKSSKEAVFAGQIYPVSNPCVKYRAVPPQTGVALQRKASGQRSPDSVPHRESMPQRPICKCEVGQTPPAASTFSQGTVLGDLFVLFKQKSLFHNWQKEKFVSSK
jgi:hypothetical protein